MDLLEKIKLQLGDNYNETSENLLNSLIDDYTELASNYSNRGTDDEMLIPYVKTAVISAYLRRGKEGSSSSNVGGMSDNFSDIEDKLKHDIQTIRVLNS